MKTIVETDRLRLRELTMGDSEFIIELLNSPGWIKFIGDRNVQTLEDAQNYLQNGPMKLYRQHDFGLWMVELKTEQTPIGICGLLKRDTLNLPDLGFCLLPQFQGKGYAYESAKAAIEAGMKDYQLEKLCAITLPENNASIRLLGRLGFGFVSAVQFPDNDETLLLYQN